MHKEAMEFLEKAIAGLDIEVEAVLEIGSLDINGSARVLFDPSVYYVGIDKRPGRGVDWQVDARWFRVFGIFDLVITTETMEHEAEPHVIVDCAFCALRSGGYLIITAAGSGRLPHDYDGGPVGDEHFGAFDVDGMMALLSEWYEVHIEENKVHCDIYATARKPQ